jgi:hypothetical protein
MAWNLHLTGVHLEDELEDVMKTLVEDLERIGHKLTGATLTTDEGQTELPVTPVEEPTQTIGGEPIVTPDTPPPPHEPTT